MDLLATAGGIDYAQAVSEVDIHDIDGVPVPFASPRLLWRMKRSTYRDKDAPDVHFLRLLLTRAGESLD